MGGAVSETSAGVAMAGTAEAATARPRRSRTLLIVAIVLFAVFSALRIYLATFPKAISITPDELRYVDLARSLFNGGSLVIRDTRSGFQKILYPLSLFPAFLFNDTIMQVKAIGILNSLYVCSAVFPAMLLAKRLFKSEKVIIVCMVLTLVVPDMCYSMSFMSECLFLPLVLWLMVVLWKALTTTGRRRLAWSSLGGFLCYAAYLCKEIALVFVIAFVLVYVIMAFRKTEGRRACILAVICFLVAFCCPYVIMKMTLFSGLHNSYSVTSPDVLLDPHTLLFAVYALANQMTHLIVAFAFFPIFFVAFTFRDLSRDDKRLFLLCITALVAGLLTIVYTISIREDIGHATLRPQLRYVSVLFIPMLFLFIKQIGNADTAAIRRSPRRHAVLVGTTAIVIVLVATMFGMVNLQQAFDNSQYYVLRWFYALFGDMDVQSWATVTSGLASGGVDGSAPLTIGPSIWLSRLLVIVFIGGGMVGLSGKRRFGTGMALVAIIAVMMMANNIVNCQYDRHIYSWDESYVEEVSAIDGYLSQQPSDTEVLIVTDTEKSTVNDLADTYIDNRHLTYRYATVDALSASTDEDGALDQASLIGRTRSSYGQADTSDVSRPIIDYILVNTRQKVAFTSGNVETVDMGDGKLFRLYRIVDDQPVTLASE